MCLMFKIFIKQLLLTRMDIFQQQSMQNWKKQIIMDPHLNCFFDTSVSAEELVTHKILGLPHQQIVKTYMKLTTLKHAITKSMQKEIELRYPIIEQSFTENYRTKNIYESIDHQNLRNHLRLIQKFNEKYQLIAEKVTECKNLNRILHFAKALEKFKVNIRILKSLMKDYDQNTSNKMLGDLVNSLKISKILKQISAITIKFDFSGIQSYQTERAFLNYTKGAIFGLIEKDLTILLFKIPNQGAARRQDLQRQIVSKLHILSNINKLKDYCVPFFKNVLKQMSELLKKSFGISQPSEQKDPKYHLSVFEQYFNNTLNRKIVENSVIFVALQDLIDKNNIKVPFIVNFFEKYWENLIGFIRDMITWSIENDSKEWAKEKTNESLYQAFFVLESKSVLNKYLTSIIWKYPIFFQKLTAATNQIHLYFIKHTKYHHYDFALQKQKLIREILPLAQQYYRHVALFFGVWEKKVQAHAVRVMGDTSSKENYPLNEVIDLLEQTRAKSTTNLQQTFKIIDWLMFNLKTQEINEYFINFISKTTDSYFVLFKLIANSYRPLDHNKDNFLHLIGKIKIFTKRIKDLIRRASIAKAGSAVQLTSDCKGGTGRMLVADADKLVLLIRQFKEYQGFIQEKQNLFSAKD